MADWIGPTGAGATPGAAQQPRQRTLLGGLVDVANVARQWLSYSRDAQRRAVADWTAGQKAQALQAVQEATLAHGEADFDRLNSVFDGQMAAVDEIAPLPGVKRKDFEIAKAEVKRSILEQWHGPLTRARRAKQEREIGQARFNRLQADRDALGAAIGEANLITSPSTDKRTVLESYRTLQGIRATREAHAAVIHQGDAQAASQYMETYDRKVNRALAVGMLRNAPDLPAAEEMFRTGRLVLQAGMDAEGRPNVTILGPADFTPAQMDEIVEEAWQLRHNELLVAERRADTVANALTAKWDAAAIELTERYMADGVLGTDEVAELQGEPAHVREKVMRAGSRLNDATTEALRGSPEYQSQMADLTREIERLTADGDTDGLHLLRRSLYDSEAPMHPDDLRQIGDQINRNLGNTGNAAAQAFARVKATTPAPDFIAVRDRMARSASAAGAGAAIDVNYLAGGAIDANEFAREFESKRDAMVRANARDERWTEAQQRSAMRMTGHNPGLTPQVVEEMTGKAPHEVRALIRENGERWVASNPLMEQGVIAFGADTPSGVDWPATSRALAARVATLESELTAPGAPTDATVRLVTTAIWVKRMADYAGTLPMTDPGRSPALEHAGRMASAILDERERAIEAAGQPAAVPSPATIARNPRNRASVP